MKPYQLSGFCAMNENYETRMNTAWKEDTYNTIKSYDQEATKVLWLKINKTAGYHTYILSSLVA